MKAVKEAMDDDGDWAATAMRDDSLVVELLLRLKHSSKHQAIRPWAGKLVADLAPNGWGVRQPRSGSAGVAVAVAVAYGSKSVVSVSECRRKSKERIGRRCSPSTPLSWSGGSGGGGGVDGCEASSQPMNRSPNSRSKISLAGSEVNGASSSKPRKKKTFTELKEEEDMLLKERMHLNQELAMLGATVQDHRAENKKLKRMKLNLITQLKKNSPCTAAALIPGGPIPSSTCCISESDAIPAQRRENIMLPDLNMMPSDLDSTN